MEILHFITLLKDSVGVEVFTSLCGIPLTVSMFFYVRRRYYLDRQFSSVRDKRRREVFESIGALQGRIAEPQTENIIKTLYESIGMYYPRRVNEYILMFICEKGWRFNHPYLNAFLKSPSLMDIYSDNIFLNQKNVRMRMWAVWTTYFILTIMIFVLINYLLFRAQSSTGWLTAILSGVSGGLAIVWASLSFAFASDGERRRGARYFYNAFSPWLKEMKNNELLSAQRNAPRSSELSLPVPYIQKEKKLTGLKRLMAGVAWKT